ncbi:MAG TPA: hypothetical protein V6C76_07405 [Drouetiella sp.]
MAVYKEQREFNLNSPLLAVQNVQPEPVARQAEGDVVSTLSDLTQAMRFATKYHLGCIRLNDEQLCGLVKKLKQLAAVELEPGDGSRVESVRVERKLDGTVSIMFGI